MEATISLALLLVFLVHLVAFAVLGLRRRQAYYLALVLTFGLLSLAVATRLALPDQQGVGDLMLHESLRLGAWAAAAVSISWTLVRVARRAGQRGRQNCS
jgi:hypothetical protein